MKAVYIIFSATPYKTGRLIRTVLRTRYNHVALSFDQELATMYTFSRFHEDAPFYGGFVVESLRRYRWAGQCSRLKVCRISMSEEAYHALRDFIAQVRGRPCIYNLYSAMVHPLHRRLLIRDSYTCVEFVGDALSIAGLDLPQGAFHSLEGLEQLLSSYVIYEGSCAFYKEPPDWGGDRFPERMGRVSGTAATARSIWQLTARGVMDALTALPFHLHW